MVKIDMSSLLLISKTEYSYVISFPNGRVMHTSDPIAVLGAIWYWMIERKPKGRIKFI